MIALTFFANFTATKDEKYFSMIIDSELLFFWFEPF